MRQEPTKPLSSDAEVREKKFDPHLVRKCLAFMRPYRGVLAVIMGLTVLQDINSTLAPRLTGMMIDRGIMEKNAGLLVTLAAGLLLTIILTCLFTAVINTRLTVFGRRVTNDLRKRMFAHLQHLSMRYYDTTREGRILARTQTDLANIERFFTYSAVWILHSVLILLIVVVNMLLYSGKLFLATLFIIPVVFIATEWFRRRGTQAYRKVRAASAALTTDLAENVSGVREVQSAVRERHNLDRFSSLHSRLHRDVLHSVRVSLVYSASVEAAMSAATCVVLLYGGYLVLGAGELKVGVLVAFMGFLGMVSGPITTISRVYNLMLSAMASAERIFDMLETNPAVADRKESYALPPVKGRVKFENVTFTYDNERIILRNISLGARPGEVVALVGPTGAGKTSIISLMARFYDVLEGRILIDGHDIRDVTQQSLRRQVGIILQDVYLFPGTVMENIRYGKLAASDEEIIEAARKLGVHEVIEKLQDGYQTDVGDRGNNLSQGQRQTLAFVRTMISDSNILILDEATSAMDTKTEEILHEATFRLAEGRTTFIIAHRLSTVRKADRLYVIQDGRVAEKGTHQELLDAGGIYTGMYNEFIRAT